MIASENLRSLHSAEALQRDIEASSLRHSPPTVTVGGALPLVMLERPFRDGPVQRDISIIPLGALYLSPVAQRALARTPFSNIADDLCGSRGVRLIASHAARNALVAYFFQHRSRRVVFEPVYSGRAINVFECRSADQDRPSGGRILP